MKVKVALDPDLAKPKSASAARTIYAPDGYLFVKGRGRMLVRQREKAELYLVAIKAELERCGVHTRKVKVREFKGPGGSAFYLNIFYLRGLDPAGALGVLRELPSRCGLKCAMTALEQLPERVEIGPAVELRPEASEVGS